jgi:quaternary ammonium compound-resistance protein SugE
MGQKYGMAWFYLVVAGLLEVVWSYAMKQSEGFTRPGHAVVTVVVMLVSVWFLSLSMKVLPLGTSYVIWTGIGAVGAFVVGIVFLGESTDPLRLIAASLILAGLLLMKIASPH